MYKKARCTCEIVVSLIETYCFFAVLVAVAVIIAKSRLRCSRPITLARHLIQTAHSVSSLS